MRKPKRVALYVRVSTDSQTTDNQRRELADVAGRRGWNVVHVFAGEDVSGAKGRGQRPGFDELCRIIARRDVDMVAAWSVDGLGRSLQDLIALFVELNGKGHRPVLSSARIGHSTSAAAPCSGCLTWSKGPPPEGVV